MDFKTLFWMSNTKCPIHYKARHLDLNHVWLSKTCPTLLHKCRNSTTSLWLQCSSQLEIKMWQVMSSRWSCSQKKQIWHWDCCKSQPVCTSSVPMVTQKLLINYKFWPSLKNGNIFIHSDDTSDSPTKLSGDTLEQWICRERHTYLG